MAFTERSGVKSMDFHDKVDTSPSVHLLDLVDLGQMARGTIQHFLTTLGPLEGSDADE